MKKPSYTLYLNQEKREKQHTGGYLRSELEDMTAVQLKSICIRERIIQGIINPLDRYELIETIMRYRGVERALLISKMDKGGMERISHVLDRKLGMEKRGGDGIRVPAKMVLYQDMDLTAFDCYPVVIPEELRGKLSDGNVLMVGEHMELCTILHLEQDGEDSSLCYLTRSGEIPFAVPAQKVCWLLFFERKESDYLYDVFYDRERIDWAVLDYYKVPLAELEIRQAEETEAVLSIDFGISNTAAGAYLDYRYVYSHDEHKIQAGGLKLDEINMVRFMEDTGYKKSWRMTVPSMVSAEDASHAEKPEYRFGYEAQKELRSRYREESCSVFYEIKRWIETCREEQEIIDKRGNTARVKRQEVIRAYLLYIIQCAEQQFKCRFKRLQIISPVKQRKQFRKMLEQILPEFTMEECCLDEGTAVAFNTIHSLIEKQSYIPGEELQAVVLDCGGGTTDLTSCHFSIDKDTVAYKVRLDTTYENGDTGFGGNYLTYRVMQYIKILLAAYYSGQTVSLRELFPVTEEEIYSFVDKNGREKLYEVFERSYSSAEEIIPTRFKDYENRSRREYAMVKNNFYFLFMTAEKLKQQFYQKEVIFSSGFGEEEQRDGDGFQAAKAGRWSLIVREGGKLVYHHELPSLMFYRQDMEYLLKGDIYEIMNRFFGEAYDQDLIQEVSLLRLTGQSCRIGLFRDALKEFVPGKRIRFQGMPKSGEEREELKLACIRGAIRYTQAKKTGMSDIRIRFHLPQIPYSVSAYTHENTEKILIYRLDRRRSGGNLSRHKEIRRLDLYLKDEHNQVRFRYVYENHPSAYRPVLYEELRENYKEYEEYLLQDDTDTIQDTEVKFFLFASKEEWGFYLVPVMREGTQLYLGEEAFYEFEREQWGLDFFDGSK